jgi:hypothetical protein
MRRERLSWALGWVNVGMAVTELTFPEGVCRVLGVSKRRAWLVRSLGLRELGIGLGLLLQPRRREWVWARVVGDAMDMALLAVSFRQPRADRTWHGVLAGATVVSALVDLYAATKGEPAHRHAGTVTPSIGMGPGTSGPGESWRGSGLAEDVGMDRPPSEDGESEEVRQRMMEDAARQLGLRP